MVAFARRFDPQPFHVDDDAAKTSWFGALAASGWFTAGLWMRLYVDEVLNKAPSLGSPGGEELSWPAPVFAGDKLRASMEVLEARKSRSRPGLGLVRLRARMHRGDVLVYHSTFTGMFGTRD
jgi:acyl dehydratase